MPSPKSARTTHSLERQLGKRQPFDSPSVEAHIAILRTAEVIQAPLERLLKPTGLSASGYNVLRILRARGIATCSEIGHDLIVRVPDVTRLIDRLEAQGFARRERGAGDRRIVRVLLTPAGTRLLAALDAPVAAAHRAQMAALSAPELTQLNRLLAKVRGESANLAAPATKPAPSTPRRVRKKQP